MASQARAARRRAERATANRPDPQQIAEQGADQVNALFAQKQAELSAVTAALDRANRELSAFENQFLRQQQVITEQGQQLVASDTEIAEVVALLGDMLADEPPEDLTQRAQALLERLLDPAPEPDAEVEIEADTTVTVLKPRPRKAVAKKAVRSTKKRS